MIIAFEGPDRAGKSTQCTILRDRLSALGIQYDYRRYPNRQHPLLGPVINDYLSGHIDLSAQSASLFLAASLWEEDIGANLAIFDRYVASCTAYSAAREMPLEQAKQLTCGIPQPDLTIYLRVDLQVASTRPGFGQERFENEAFQKKVLCAFDELVTPNWVVINADQPREAISTLIWKRVEQLLN